MKRIINWRGITYFLMIGLLAFVVESCGSKGYAYQKPRNGGARVNSSGKIGYKKDRNRHVWGK
ncbi:MAG: hypothetical protein Kow0079_02210 [Vicingaceae bacterium]